MDELIWSLVFMIGVFLLIGLIVWYIDWQEEKKKKSAHV
jgi:ABC-type transporter Mla subunit MlaD